MSLKKNVIANSLGQIWGGLITLVFIPVYIQYLGMEAIGLIGIFAVMQVWLTFLDMGMTPTLNREMAKFSAGAHLPQSIHDLLRSLEIICIFIAIIITLSGWLMSSYIAANWLNVDKLAINEVTQAISIMSLVIALRFIEGIYRGSLLGLQRQVFYNLVSAIFATLRYGGAAIIVVFISPTVEAFFLWQAISSLLITSVFFSAVWKALPKSVTAPSFKLEAITNIWKFASGVTLVTFLAILLTQIDKVLLSRLLSLESFGYYTIATSLAGVLYMMVSPITTAFYPRLVELYTNNKKNLLVSSYHQGCQLITVLTATPALMLCLFSKDIIFIWSGNDSFAESVAPILSTFVVGVYLNGLMHMPAQLQLAHGWVNLSIKSNIFAVIFLVPALFWAVPKYGALGSSWVWVILNISYILFSIQLMHRKILIYEKWKWYLSDVFLPTIGALVIVCIAKFSYTPSYSSRFYEFLFLMIFGIFAYIASILLASKIRAKFYDNLKRIVMLV